VLALPLLALGCSRLQGPDSAVAARVNGKEILKSEVDDYFRVRTKQLEQQPSGDSANILKLNILRELIEAEFMAQKAAELKILPTDAEIDSELKTLKGEVPDQEFRKTLEDRGVSEADLRKEIGRSLTIQKVAQNQVRDRVQVTDAQIQQFYDENREAFNIKEPMYRIGVIAVSSDPDSPVNNLQNDKALDEEQALRKIQMLEARVRAGEDFQQLAAQYSEDTETTQRGGDMGYQTAAMLERFGTPFKDTIIKMNVGDLTPVVRVEGGYFLFRLLGIREPGQHDLSSAEVKEGIRAELQTRKQQVLTAAFNEQIHNEARVENFLAREILAGFQAAQ
jgi:peptidyl-prolyl cis-trans isomerase SurA